MVIAKPAPHRFRPIPAKHSQDGVGEIVVGVDCSGSINRRQLGLFQDELNSIISERRPRRVHVIYFDTQVHNAAIFEQSEPITLEPVGGGGTSFCPCFEYIEENSLQHRRSWSSPTLRALSQPLHPIIQSCGRHQGSLRTIRRRDSDAAA